MKKTTKQTIKAIITTIIIGLFLYYLFLPAINITNPGFWTFLIAICIIYIIVRMLFVLDWKRGNIYANETPNEVKYIGFLIFGIILFLIGVNVILSPIFQAKSYSKRIEIIENGNFKEDVKEVDFTKIPLLDKDSTEKLGDRIMGEMTDLVSQFYVSNLYTQINYNNQIVRVTPLEYSGIIKYFTNRKSGVEGYIIVDSNTGESKLTRLEKGMKYMPSAMFQEDLYRKLRFSYPTLNFGEESFELDNDGKPYWVVPIITYHGVGIKEEITGVILLDPITGNTKRYDVDEVPSWVDHVYNADVILEQVNDWGHYKNGYLNSLFGQKNVVATTEGYNYLVMDDDVYLYTGITSVVQDESNLGFILANMRTKETTYYSVAGAEEFSAMESAKGQIQQMNYTSTFPLLINLKGRPTYLISLKDNAGLVKMYAFVDVVDYQKVVVTESSQGIEVAAKNYLNNIKHETINNELITKEIKVQTIKTVLIDGNTYYYFTDDKNQKYKVSIKVAQDILPFISRNQKIKISYIEETDVIEIIKLN